MLPFIVLPCWTSIFNFFFLRPDNLQLEHDWNVQGPFRTNGLHFVGRSESSSTDPSSYHPNTASFDDEETNHQSGDQTPTPSSSGIRRSRSPMLTRTPSLVDDLLCEIYSRFGTGYGSHRPLDSSQRASASGSQVRILVRISNSKNREHFGNGIFFWSVLLRKSV